MRFIVTFIWSLLICSVISYILTNMSGDSFQFLQTIILSVVFTLLIYLLGEGVLKQQND